ncbi:MAG: pyruvate kinase [Hyphomicrobiales bacterium]
MKRDRRAKIVATLGPASSNKITIAELFYAGVDVFRMNFSHGTHEDHAANYQTIRELEQEAGRPIGVLQDLQGPKIRTGEISGGTCTLQVGTKVRFDSDPIPGDSKRIPLLHPEVHEAIKPGDAILINDGRVRLETVQVGDDYFEAEVSVGGEVSDRKGVNLPDTVMKLTPLTEKDRKDLDFGLELGVDWVALSFVQRPSDVTEARRIIGNKASLLVKIEKPAALKCLDEIVPLVDSIMVARGDLGVEIPPEEVPGAQKEMVRACRLAGKPVIIATQMLESMVSSPSPTRAEASDVATAIYDGADAVMLSAESAIGNYPVKAVEMMNSIVHQTENHQTYRSIINALQPNIEPSAPHAVSAAAADVANAIGAAAVVAFTSSGTTARRVARKRPEVPILSVSPDRGIARRLALLWGVHSIQSEDISNHREMVVKAAALSVNDGFASWGDQIVVVAGIPFGEAGSTNNLRVIKI